MSSQSQATTNDAPWYVTPEEVIDTLDIHEFVAGDISTVEKHEGKRRERDDQRVHEQSRIDKSYNTAVWRDPRKSCAYLIHGGYSYEPMSPLSAYAARLYKSTTGDRKHEAVVPLIFFCGLHHFAGPRAMMASLCQQLCYRVKPIGRKLRLKRFEQAGTFDPESIRDLCTMFKDLVYNFPRGTQVLCLVDGISDFVQKEEYRKNKEDALKIREDAEIALKTLLKSPKSHDGGRLCFKLLVTSLTCPDHILPLFKQHDAAKDQHDDEGDIDYEKTMGIFSVPARRKT